MNRENLFKNIIEKKSFLCVGLDTDVSKVPSHLLKEDDAIFTFNKAIIDATEKFAVCYKLNSAFYETEGSNGWEAMQKTFDYLPASVFKIADAKRGDIGNTSAMYAKAFLQNMNADAITVAPYMGEDSVKPFLSNENKWVILLALTSNAGSKDFQFNETNGEKLFENVLRKSFAWGNTDNMMYVVGATHPEDFSAIRKIVPEHFLLVPGVGAQGGDLKQVAKFGMNKQVGLFVNSSRQIIYASNKNDFAEAAAREAKKVQQEMEMLLNEIK